MDCLNKDISLFGCMSRYHVGMGAQSAWLILPSLVLGSPTLFMAMVFSIIHWSRYRRHSILHILDIVFATVAFLSHFQFGYLSTMSLLFFILSKYVEHPDGNMRGCEFWAHTGFRLCAIMMVLPPVYRIPYSGMILVHTLWILWNRYTNVTFHSLEIIGNVLLQLALADKW